MHHYYSLVKHIKKLYYIWMQKGRIIRPDYVFNTAFIFLFMYLLSKIPINFEFVNPLDEALEDFELTDIVFSQNLREEQQVDTNIVIVNFGNHRRNMIAKQIEAIIKHDPAVIGIDAHFFKLQDPTKDSLLRAAFSKVKQLVLISELPKANDDGSHDSLILSNPYFMENAKTGFADVVSLKEIRTSRSFSPKERVADSIELAFSVKIAHIFDSVKTEKFLSRAETVEIINFRGNQDKFLTIDAFDLFDESKSIPNMKNKIVLMGYMGYEFEKADDVIIDKFFTPMNPRYAGKSHPDMFGIVIHANIISMILNDTTISTVSETLKWIITILICYLVVVFCYKIRAVLPEWYDPIVKLSQIGLALLILYIGLLIFSKYRLQIELFEAVVAVLLTGDLVEVYQDTIPNLIKNKPWQKLLFWKQQPQTLE